MGLAKAKLLYKDKAGNKLFVRNIKTRSSLQLFGKNKQGRLVNTTSLRKLTKKAGMKLTRR